MAAGQRVPERRVVRGLRHADRELAPEVDDPRPLRSTAPSSGSRRSWTLTSPASLWSKLVMRSVPQVATPASKPSSCAARRRCPGAERAAGEPDRAGGTRTSATSRCACSTGPRSSSSTSMSISRRPHVRVLDEVAGVVDRGDRGAGLARRRRSPRRGCARRSSRRRRRRAGRRARPARGRWRTTARRSPRGGPPARSTRSAIALGAGGHGHPAAVARSGRCCAARCWRSGCRARGSTVPSCS